MVSHTQLTIDRRSRRLHIALVGAGYMGANHARIAAAHPLCELSVIVDSDRDRAGALTEKYGGFASTNPADALLADAVVIAAPTEAHYELGGPIVDAGIPLLMEKPFAFSMAQTEELISRSTRSDSVAMCGFVERFNPAILAARKLIEGEIHHVVSIRHSPRNPRATASVVMDLLIHDIDLALSFLDHTLGGSIVGRSVRGEAGLDEIADCSISVPGTVATLSASRFAHRKIRQFSISTSELLLELDLLRQDVTVYRHLSHEVTTGELASYRSATLVDVPFVQVGGEPLALQFDRFLQLAMGAPGRDAERQSLLSPHLYASTLADLLALTSNASRGSDLSSPLLEASA